ncbi:NADH-quinone oxidoreductase subunit NuoH [Picrophilus oshimae]|uniref:NADH dehydrogenase subunit H n=1 Tax=Picrophilus torridus (strain ATCC 700027 / DSM 9790 / JCM 10055 / NBRC 100828 / KAW 2/3) TaxID=1122961 RepID=Q6KZ63_PICTO|nr:NADH-quinone oxidoreductase subunit NuoH [Picrophilus oshimae]AAT43989.1 NADH-quinone oxidoreductase chain H [Picrophilus oshimae DSM 9789]SMD30940.1 NADH dehydrogenase subunit H [Picrophilus oshimae DSM 9789]
MNVLLRIHQWLSPLGIASYPLAYIIEIIIFFILVAISFVGLIYFFRKYMARIQLRIGPNRVGKFGLLQLIADALKLIQKEPILPKNRDDLAYKTAPILVMISVITAFILIPYGSFYYFGSLNIVNSQVTIILVFAVLSIMPIGEVIGGISTKSNYALLGTLRGIAKDVSFEVPMIISVLAIIMIASRKVADPFSITGIVTSEIIPYGIVEPLGLIVFFIGMVARASHSPYDLAESDSELITGYTTEYSGMRFGLFYIPLFAMVFFASLLISLLYLGGYNGPLSGDLGLIYLLIKAFVLVMIFFLIWISLPRIRIDRFVNMGWKYLLPISIINLVYAGLITLYVW